jgi:hypothetical protein
METNMRTSAIETLPKQEGYIEQPQNFDDPSRRTITAEHSGHSGAATPSSTNKAG